MPKKHKKTLSYKQRAVRLKQIDKIFLREFSKMKTALKRALIKE